MVKNPHANAGDVRDMSSIPGQKDPLKEEMQPTPVFLPGECHGQRSLAGYSPWGQKESDMTEATKHTPKGAKLGSDQFKMGTQGALL